MSKFSAELKKIWAKDEIFLAKKETDFDENRLQEVFRNIFCPGPYYYYLLDFSSRKMDYVHYTLEEILNIPTSEASVDRIGSQIHPDDLNHFLSCESFAAKFLFYYLKPEQITSYKVSYCYRIRNQKTGQYHLMLHQAIALTTDELNRLGKVLGIHTCIDHITDTNNMLMSFLGVDGAPSYYNLNPYQEEVDFSQYNYSPLSHRETEIVRLLAEGFTAQEIAEKLYISFDTIRTHRRNILKKMGCKNTPHLVATCLRQGII